MRQPIEIDCDQLAAAILGASYLSTHHRLYIDDNPGQEQQMHGEWQRCLNQLCERAEKAGICVEWLLRQGRVLAVAEYEQDHPDEERG